jgi:hypothetical protein
MFRTGTPRPHSQFAPFRTYAPTLGQNQRTMHAHISCGGRLRITPANLLTTPLYLKTILPHYPNHCQGKTRQNSPFTQNPVVTTCTCIMGCGKGMYRLKPPRPPFSCENAVFGVVLAASMRILASPCEVSQGVVASSQMRISSIRPSKKLAAARSFAAPK